MAVSRRSFLLGVGGGAAALPWISGRGLEAEWGPVHRLERPPRRAALIRLDSNENPNGPPPSAVAAIREALTEACRYPGGHEDDLRHAIATSLGVDPAEVLVGCGSTELLNVAVDAFTSRGRGVVTAAPSFEAPATHAAARGVPVTAVRVDRQLLLDLDAMLDSARGAGFIYVCNPNNPTGTLHPTAAIESFVERVLARAPAAHVVVDEAYLEYVDRARYGGLLALAREEPRVIVLRTFSKVFGMAGLRVGHAVGRPETIAAMQRFRLRMSVNVLGAAAARAALSEQNHVERERRALAEARNFTRRFFEEAGFTVVPSEANFLMVHIRRSSLEFKRACEARGVAVGRPFPPLDDYARISIGTADEMRRATRVFRAVLT